MHCRFHSFALLGFAFVLAGCGGAKPVPEIKVDAAATAGLLPAPSPAPDDWPWWRGINVDGKGAPDAQPPLKWSATENIVWRTPVAGRGHASPTIWGGRIFVATADEKLLTQSLICYGRDDGKLLWQQKLHEGEFIAIHEKNSHASPTPCCDGEKVYLPCAVKESLWLSAVTVDGTVAWQKEVGPYISEHGYSASPALFEGLIIVACDHDGAGYLAALDRRDGKIVWRINRTEKPSYSTPIVATVAGKPQLLLSGCSSVNSYDPRTGERFWHCDGPSEVTACTMTYTDNLVFASGGHNGSQILCIQADGSGDVTKTHVKWRARQGVTYVPSPLVHDKRLYVVDDQGVLTCFLAATGNLEWQQRLGGNFSSSLILAGDRMYVADEEGNTTVFRGGFQYEELARNALPEGQFATPVALADRLYVRTIDALYCIADPAAAGTATQ